MGTPLPIQNEQLQTIAICATSPTLSTTNGESWDAQASYSEPTMKGEKLWEQYTYYAQNLTEHSRKLGFAGVAICWLFHTPEMTFPKVIYFALALFVIFFMSDVLQYLAGAITLKLFVESQEKKQWEKYGNIDGEIQKPRWVDRPAYAFFLLKSVALLSGFAVLLLEFYRRIKA